MSNAICRLTVAACTEDAHSAVDLTLPAGMTIGELLPQIVDIVHGEAAQWIRTRDWRLSRLGEHPMDESMTLHDNGVRDGEVLVLTTIEPPPAERIECDPSHLMVADAAVIGKPVPRILSVLCCVLFGGCGALALALPGMGVATASRLATGTCVAVAATVGAAVLRRRSDDPLLCVPMSLTAVFYAGAVGYVAVPGGPPASGILLGAAAAFGAAILVQRVTNCGRILLTAIATLSAQIAAVAAAGATWRLEPTASGAALAVVALAIIGFAPRIAMVLNGIGPSTSRIDAAPCHRTLTGLVVGASIAAALGAPRWPRV